MLSYYMYLVFSQVLCLIQIFYQILPKQNSIRGQTIRQSDWCGDTISSKRSFFLNTKAHLTPFWKRKTTKILGGFGLSHSATWVAQSTCHQPKHPKRILQNSSAQISHPLKTASPLPPIPAGQTTNSSMRTFPLLLLISFGLIAIASGLHSISIKKCQSDTNSLLARLPVGARPFWLLSLATLLLLWGDQEELPQGGTLHGGPQVGSTVVTTIQEDIVGTWL